MNMCRRVIPIMILAALAVAPIHAQAQTNPFLNIPITGTIPGVNGVFTGTLNITSFDVQNGVLVAVGTITGTLRDAAGNIIGTVTNFPVAIPTQASGSCEILTLDLGPLNLNLLGLVVMLNEINLQITAVPGAGNLLGNLLCAVAGLLDGGNASQNAIAALLNNILRAIGRL